MVAVGAVRVLVVGLLLATVFSGCLGDDATDLAPETGTDGTDRSVDGAAGEVDRVLLGLEPPVWSIGDHWTFATSEGDTSVMVVTEDLGSDWRIDTDNDDVAFYHAQEDVSTLGAQRKSDLAGSQGSDRVQFFRFPLEVDATWSTPWDGETIQVEVVGHKDGVWTFEARNESGGLHAQYSYDASIGWFGHLDFYGPDGTVFYGNEIKDSGSDWTGEVVRYSLENKIAHGDGKLEPHTPGLQSGATSVAIEEGQDVYLVYDMLCDNGAFGVTILFEGSTAPDHHALTPCEGLTSVVEIIEAKPGDAAVSHQLAADSGDLELRLDLRTRTTLTLG